MKSYYFDSSAIIKLAILERETKPLRDFINQVEAEGTGPFLTSEISRVEVLGKLAQLNLDASAASALFDGFATIPLKRSILDLAITSRRLGLKTLDAIHHATVSYLFSDLEAVVCYDLNLTKVLNSTGIRTVSPGA